MKTLSFSLPPLALLLTFVLAPFFAGPTAFAQANKENNYGGQERFVELDGVACRYLVLFPKNPPDPLAPPPPVWIGLHGVVGCSEHAMWAWHDAAREAGAILIAPQGTARRESDGEGYHRWDRQRDARSFLLMLDALEKETPIDRTRISLLGFSDGGWLTLQTLAAQPDTYHFAAVIAGAFWGEIDEAGLRRAARAPVPMPLFYACGQADVHVNADYPDTLARLRDLGFSVTAENPPEVDHTPRPFNPGLLAAHRAAPPRAAPPVAP
jgi:poly(3-hydroxybutyrate) depolymerase